MSGFTKRYLIVFILLSSTALITFGHYSTEVYSDIIYTQDIPMIIGGWHGRSLASHERTYEILETRDVFMGEYTNSGKDIVFLAVVFSRDNRRVAHPPETCFIGSGWSKSVRDLQTVTLGTRELRVNRMILQKGEEANLVLYLYKAGGKHTHNYYIQQFNLVLNSLLLKKTSSALIRISCYVDGDNLAEAMKRVKIFTAEAIPVLDRCLPW